MFYLKQKSIFIVYKFLKKSKINLEKQRKYGKTFERFQRKLTKTSDQNQQIWRTYKAILKSSILNLKKIYINKLKFLNKNCRIIHYFLFRHCFLFFRSPPATSRTYSPSVCGDWFVDCQVWGKTKLDLGNLFKQIIMLLLINKTRFGAKPPKFYKIIF